LHLARIELLAAVSASNARSTSAATIPKSTANNLWRWCASRQSIRFATNKHSSTEPDVTAVSVILIKLPTAFEITGIGRSARRNDFGLRFLAAMAILGRVRLLCGLTLTLHCRVDPDHEHTIAPMLHEMLKLSGQSDVTKGDGLQKRRIRFRKRERRERVLRRNAH
jgi:hypothetical protein